MLFLISYPRLSSFASENKVGKTVLDNSAHKGSRCTQWHRKIFLCIVWYKNKFPGKITNISTLSIIKVTELTITFYVDFFFLNLYTVFGIFQKWHQLKTRCCSGLLPVSKITFYLGAQQHKLSDSVTISIPNMTQKLQQECYMSGLVLFGISEVATSCVYLWWS